MDGSVLAEPVMDRLRKQFPAYHDTAYLFVLAALHFTIQRIGEARHIGGRELAEGCRDLALERYGLMARHVLEFWGLRATRDFGEVVFALVECGVLVKQDGDSVADFEGVFCFADAFESNYAWQGCRALRSAL
ncbi:MAG TPA: Minf_1886 family protein [Longimicrobium sp.]|nr:Minf_1886 family protein [Longimicrobium sp.]